MPVQTLYSNNLLKIIDGVKVATEEQFVLSEKGMKIKYYAVKNNIVEKITIIGKDGSYHMKKIVGDTIVENDLDNKGLVSALKDSKLKFAKEYIKLSTKSGEMEGGIRKKTSAKKTSAKKTKK
jgi:hypothetical protein